MQSVCLEGFDFDMACDSRKWSRNMKRIAVILPLALILCSCAGRRHIGMWSATGVGEEGYSVKFENKGVAQVITPEGVYPGTYVIDYTQEPIRLDVTWNGKTTKCIIEFIDDQRFKIIGESDPNKFRPLTFEPGEDVVVFRKVGKTQKRKLSH
jgi:hypothetical protein